MQQKPDVERTIMAEFDKPAAYTEVVSIAGVRQRYAVTAEEWALVIANTKLSPEQLASAERGESNLPEDEELLLRLALAYVMHLRGEQSMERMHTNAVVHLSWPEYKQWKLSGVKWEDFYATEIKPKGIRIGDKLWARKDGALLTVDAIEDGLPFSFIKYDPDDKRMIGGCLRRRLSGRGV